MHFWTAVSTIAGAMRRRVWLAQPHFTWFPNFYIIMVAPPGVVAKSTTTNIGMSLLRNVPDITFGPDVVTWQALLGSFVDSSMAFEYQGEFHTMCALTIQSSEFGNLFNPREVEMVDLFVELYDSRTGSFEKKTKSSGNDHVENPYLNLIACTTPSWIAGNFPEYLVGGGFTSRCLFVYADKKAKLVAYPGKHVPPNFREQAQKLFEDLCQISIMTGEFQLTDEAYAWGTEWYEKHSTTRHLHLDDDRFGGYLIRKQGHVHKLAMVLSAAEDNSLTITAEHLALANQMITDLEPDMQFVFSKIGKSDESIYAERIIWYVKSRQGCDYREALRFAYAHFPKIHDLEDIFAGAIKAGYIKLQQRGDAMWLVPGDCE